MAIATPNNGGGGYEYHFVATPADWLMCNICHYPSRDPYLSGCCGHTFCKSCLEGAKKATTISDACPICRNEEFPTVPNKQADRTVRSLHVFCTNKEKGCEWQGEVNNIVSHVTNSDGCQFEEVICTNGCRMCVQRQYLSSHVEDECVCRMVDCQYCHITGEHQLIEGEHKDQCPKFPIACPNKCEVDNISREDIDEHRKMCPLEEVTCPNDCETSLQRRYIHTHIKMECPRLKVECQHCHITGEQQFIEGEHKEQCPKFPVACPNNCEVGSVPRDDVEEHKKMCPLELIQCEYHMVGCEERMARKDQKKHNKEKMEEHLSFAICQLTKAQHNLASSQVEAVNSREELTAKTTQIGKDLVTTKQQLTSTQIDTVKTIDRLIQRLQQTERDFATKQELTTHQLEKYKDDLTAKVEQVEKESKEQLAITENNLTLKLQQTENDLTTTKQELVATKQNFKDDLKVSKEENKRTIDKIEEEMIKSFVDQSKTLADMNTNLTNIQEEERKWKDDLIQQLEKTKDELGQKLTNTKRDLNTTKQQLAVTKDDLSIKLQQTENDLTATKQELVATKENLRTTKDELKVSQEESKRATDKLERKMRKKFDDESKKLADMNTNLMNTQEESRKWKDDLIQQLAATKQEAKKTVDDLTQRLIASQQEARKTKNELTQKLTNTERDLNTTKQQLATTCQNLTKAEKKHTTLAANTDGALAKLETKFQTNITGIETAAQKRITELEQKNEMLHLFIGKDTLQYYTNINTMAAKLSSGDRVVPVIVKMSEYTKKKSDDVHWFSDSFYTHHKGYRMTLLIKATGYSDGRGTHLSVGLVLMKGPYDDQLSWSWGGYYNVKLMLLNQISNSEHLARNMSMDLHDQRVTSGERSTNYNSYPFISNEDLHKITPTCQYLKDDNIFIKVDIFDYTYYMEEVD
ncbi:putative leucine-rich repeat-containing protein DDB_G0290503 [Dysidea avara]|uniref:putative leucine-rich repeat-containing protein DDB_G0290503 n=1 Tax=Dysidea avara TaxID=196820 RepID=UPI00332338DF